MRRPTPYIDSDTLDQAREAYRLCVPVSHIAARLGLDAPELCRLLGIPQWRDVPVRDSADDSDRL